MFLLVPAHPGCPGQHPKSRKMVVIVFLCFSLMNLFNIKCLVTVHSMLITDVKCSSSLSHRLVSAVQVAENVLQAKNT